MRIAQKLFWWKSPADALHDPLRFAAQVMTLGAWDDVQVARAQLGDEMFARVLSQPPAGIFDEASWIYWHNFFRVRPIPALPRRQLS